MLTTAEIILCFFGAIMAVMQGLGFFILTDLRERIMRLETGQMAATRTSSGGD